MIVKIGKGKKAAYLVFSKGFKRFMGGPYTGKNARSKADERIRQIEFFKRRK